MRQNGFVNDFLRFFTQFHRKITFNFRQNTKKELYQNDYSDRVDNSSDFMPKNAKKQKKTPPKGAKSKGYTALSKKYSDLTGFKPKVCREVENRCDCS